jgi:hypothetical protein
MLKIFDNTDLPGEFGLRHISFPFADGIGLDPFEALYVITVEIVCQLLLGKMMIFSARFKIFTKIQNLP